jgi:hypothetical protein
MNRIRHTILQLILDRRRAQQKHILLNQLCRLVQRIPTAINRSSRPVIYSRPLSILRLWNIPIGDAQRSQSLRRTVLFKISAAIRK